MPQNKNRRWDPFRLYQGKPGYRTQEGRSGLDPIDTYREEAFMEGLFLKRLFTLKLKTHDRFHLALMLVFGLALILLIVPFLIWYFQHLINVRLEIAILAVIYLGLVLVGTLVIGVFLLINFTFNVLHVNRGETQTSQPRPRLPKDRRKKLPKRRKDYH